jgi:hypothetical protein
MLRPQDIIPHLGKGILHWRAGRSAAELANAWWNARGIPKKVRSIFSGAEEWEGLEILEAFFERKTDLGTPGWPSQTDLLIISDSPQGRGIIAVEGKADEPFDDLVEKWLRISPSQGKERRLKSLCKMLGLDERRALELRYQLLHRTAAAIIEAKRFRCPDAFVLVHHFTPSPNADCPNFDDFSKFASAIGVPVVSRNTASERIHLSDVNVRFGWVDDVPAPPVLTSRDLIIALGWHSHLRGVDNELGKYWHLRFELLTRAFGLPPDCMKTIRERPR